MLGRGFILFLVTLVVLCATVLASRVEVVMLPMRDGGNPPHLNTADNFIRRSNEFF